jgi:hypothetical protein
VQNIGFGIDENSLITAEGTDSPTHPMATLFELSDRVVIDARFDPEFSTSLRFG